jgi:3-oxoacyl-[acyl-carrier protein] reductase
MKNVAIFGSSGALGTAISNGFNDLGFETIQITSSSSRRDFISTVDDNWINLVTKHGQLNSVIWAQGFNQSDSIETFSVEMFNRHIEANVTYILDTMHQLIFANAIAEGARIVVLSSIWQDSARPNKLSYIVSKSALKGLISSLCIDLGAKGISVNAVLPGVTETPMTHQNLTAQQISNVVNETPLSRLPSIDDISRTVIWLATTSSNGINGEFITVDNGWTRFRNV